MAEIWSIIKVLIPVFLVMGGGYLVLRDMAKENRLRIVSLEKEREEEKKKQEKKNSDLLNQINALEEKRQKDLIESKSMEGINAVIDTKIKIEIAAIMQEISKQRHDDLMLFKDAIFSLKESFSGTLSEIRETLVKFNGTLESLGKEVERVKDTKTNNNH